MITIDPNTAINNEETMGRQGDTESSKFNQGFDNPFVVDMFTEGLADSNPDGTNSETGENVVQGAQNQNSDSAIQTPSLRDDPVVQPAQGGQNSTETAQNQPPEVASLQQQLSELQETKVYLETEEFQAAKVVATELKKDAVGFVKTYMPQVVDAIARELGLASSFEKAGDDPRAFAVDYSERELASKYGEEFVFDPTQANYVGTESYNYAIDRQILVNEGYQKFHEERYNRQQQQQQQQYAAIEAAKEQAAKIGVDTSKLPDVFEMAENYGKENPLGTYYEMLFVYLKHKGMLDTYLTAPSAPGTVVKQNNSALPPPGIAGTPTGNKNDTQDTLNSFNDFPLGMYYGGRF